MVVAVLQMKDQLQNMPTQNAQRLSSLDAKGYIQTDLWGEPEEDPSYLSKQLITYIGNKRTLLGAIDTAISKIQNRLGKHRLRMLDAFAGSGVVSRNFKRHALYLATIDIEDYSRAIAECFLRNRNTIDYSTLQELVIDLNTRVDSVEMPMGFIRELYAPERDDRIKKDDRVFYSTCNARRLDNYRRMLDDVPSTYRNLLMGPLLSKASVHANTSGVFKGFYKDRHSKIGRFGGTNGDALKRILGRICLEPPVLSRFECEVEVLQGDVNTLAPRLRNLDLAYLDPPYNQHPYGSNYFMLNLVVSYERPDRISRVSGIPVNWRRSDYNVRTRSRKRFAELLNSLDAKFLLVSFNDEGFISPSDMTSMLRKIGTVDVMELQYNTFRGCRNLKNRKTHVIEQLFLVERR